MWVHIFILINDYFIFYFADDLFLLILIFGIS